MLYRKILKDLEKWRNSTGRKPLILRGARQVGKTTLVDEFGKGYKQYVKLNLEKSKDAGFFIQYGDDVRKIFEAILLSRNLKNNPSETLLFIDEIQEVPHAINLLRYFYEDMPELHVISAGSLLEVALGKVKSFPVGRVFQMPVNPLDFEEFLMAMGEEIALEYYQKCPIPDLAVNKLLTLFNEFIIVGGMPEVVDRYRIGGRLITAVTEVYSSIWDNYRGDVEKYSEGGVQREILRHILDVAPHTRDRITFNGFGNSPYGSSAISKAFRVLHKTGLLRLIYPTNELQLPLKPNLRRKPKIQFVDTGLLNYAAGIQAQLLKLEDLNNYYKGYLVNHMVFQERIAQSERINHLPYFWTREKSNSNAEVDWVHQSGEQVFPVEIKSGASGRLRSLMEFIDRSNHSTGFRLLANKVSIEDLNTITGTPMKLINLPYFCGGKIDQYIEWALDEAGKSS
ncbi:MAG: DUF4143 domain-containing protein [Saprospirales bacterium]|nr:MAG: DUF4143 domain-containing protein [Saprospirales bacterium]